MSVNGAEPGPEPDQVTRAAIEAVSDAVELADEQRRAPSPRGHGPTGWLAAWAARRARRARGVRRIGAAVGEAARQGARAGGRRAASGGRWLSEQVLAMAPRLPVRDLATLRAQFPGRSPDEVAQALIAGAARASAMVGVAVGAWAVLPFPPAAGAEIAAETLAVVGIEVKLVAELHEVYGLRAPGGVIDRMTAYVAAWAQRRGVSLAPGGLVVSAGSPLARQLRRRLSGRAGRSVASLGPLLTGAVAGAALNRHETRKLGRMLTDDLRARSPHRGGWPPES